MEDAVCNNKIPTLYTLVLFIMGAMPPAHANSYC